MKTLIVYLENAADGRIDRIEIPEGTTLRDTSDAKNRPFINVGSIVRVEFIDTEAAEAARIERQRHTAFYPDNDRGHLMKLPRKGTNDV
jgi:hypothetical protein